MVVAASLLSACSPEKDAKTASAPPATAAAWDQQSRAAAEAAAKRILTTWAQPKLAYEAWWNDLKPLLSPEARDVYSHTDPANIPAIKVTGKGVETNDDNPFVVTITFPTTEGKFGVDLSRTEIPGKWIGESIIFPGEESRLQG